jgi:mRNA-degrading endonuclease RelE of RelBE toxin-antitoxin system
MKFRVLIHKKADEFLKGLKSEDKQRIVDKLNQLEDFLILHIFGEVGGGA